MSLTIRPTFGAARVRVVQIAYYCDVTDDSGPVIPLGVMVDFRVGMIRGLGLRARTGLTNAELADVGGLIREHLRRPFKMLSEEFRRVWKSGAKDDVFADLPSQHMGALRFEAQPRQSTPLRLPRQLATSDTNQSDAVTVWTKEKLRAYCINGYLTLLERHWQPAAITGALQEKLVA